MAKHIPPSNIPTSAICSIVTLPARRRTRGRKFISWCPTQRAHCVILFSAFCLSPNSSASAQRVSLPAQVAIKKLDDHVQRIPGLRNIYVVEETVEESFPHMQFRINS
jgi:hypothetical protein